MLYTYLHIFPRAGGAPPILFTNSSPKYKHILPKNSPALTPSDVKGFKIERIGRELRIVIHAGKRAGLGMLHVNSDFVDSLR